MDAGRERPWRSPGVRAGVLALLFITGCATLTGKFPQRHTADEDSYAVTATSEIAVVYVGARDCPPCWRYKANDHPGWVASDEYKRVSFRELDFTTFQNTPAKRWPEDLRWIPGQTVASAGAPRWVVLVDGVIVSNEKRWTKRSYPLIRRLVARKLRAGKGGG